MGCFLGYFKDSVGIKQLISTEMLMALVCSRMSVSRREGVSLWVGCESTEKQHFKKPEEGRRNAKVDSYEAPSVFTLPSC